MSNLVCQKKEMQLKQHQDIMKIDWINKVFSYTFTFHVLYMHFLKKAIFKGQLNVNFAAIQDGFSAILRERNKIL